MNSKLWIRKLAALVVIATFALGMTACPAKSDIEKAYNISENISITIETAADNVAALYTAGVISFELKETLIKRLRQARDGGKRFHAEVDALYAVYKSKLPDEKIGFLDVALNAGVVQPFTDILVDIKVLSPAAQQKVLAAIVLARQAIVTLINLFVRARGRTSANYEFYIREKELNANA